QLVDRLRVLAPGIDLLGGDDKSPGCPEARDEGLIAGHDGEDVPESTVNRGEEGEGVDLRHPGLDGHRAAWSEPLPDEGIELLGEEHARRRLFQGLDEVDRGEVEVLRGLVAV